MQVKIVEGRILLGTAGGNLALLGGFPRVVSRAVPRVHLAQLQPAALAQGPQCET